MSIEKAPEPPASGPGSAAGDADDARLVRVAIVFYGLLFAAALIWTRLESRPLAFRHEAAAQGGVAWLRDVSLGLAAAAALVVASRALTAATSAGRALAEALARVLGRPGLGVCLALAAISGIAEEAFFRGALQPRVGLVVASALFGAAHFAPRREFLPWPFFAVAAGLAFGALFDATGNLVAPVVAHAGVNAWNLRWLATRRDGTGDSIV
jgi:membrane protease YdiL (CAAX protease family)